MRPLVLLIPYFLMKGDCQRIRVTFLPDEPSTTCVDLKTKRKNEDGRRKVVEQSCGEVSKAEEIHDKASPIKSSKELNILTCLPLPHEQSFIEKMPTFPSL